MLEKFRKAGKRIKFIREYRGLTVEEMAEQLDESVDRLRQIEDVGSGLYGELLLKISLLLNVDHNYIFEGYTNRIRDEELLKHISDNENEIF